MVTGWNILHAARADGAAHVDCAHDGRVASRVVGAHGMGDVPASNMDQNYPQAAEEALWRARGDFETEKAAWGQECVEVRRRLVAAEL